MIKSMRSVRKVTHYLCTHCFHSFPDGVTARKHVKDAHGSAKGTSKTPKRARRGPTQTGRVHAAIQGGAKTAKDVSKKTRIPLPRVHSLLTYLRKRGKITGYADDLRAK